MAESGELIAELIVAEGIDRPVLVGHSTGAQVVAETAARHPELVDSLVLIGPTVNPRERTLAKQTARFLQDIAVLNPKVFAQGVASYAEAGPRWYARNLRPMLEHRIELVLPEIAAPTLVVRGEHDRIVPRYWAEEVAALLPDGRYAEVPGRGHETMVLAGGRVGDLIARHARGEPAGRPMVQPDEPLKSEQMNTLSALGWWALDYAYAGWRQLAVLGARRLPSAWRTGDADKPEVVLLPGVYEHWSFLRPLGDALNAAGHRVAIVHGLRLNRRPIVETSDAARARPRPRAGAAGRTRHRRPQQGRARRQAPAAPRRGRGAAAARTRGDLHAVRGRPARSRLFTDPSIRALLPGDETIVMLGNAASVNGRIVSVFGTFDAHVPDGSALDGATNVRVPVAGPLPRARRARDPARGARRHRADLDAL